MSLAGVSVLIPASGALAGRCADEVHARCGLPILSPLIVFSAPTGEPLAEFKSSVRELQQGSFDWLAVTSPRTVAALRSDTALEGLPGSVRVAAVGESTAAALRDAHVAVHLVASTNTAPGLVAQWPSGSGRVFLPQSSIAHDTLAVGLRAAGWDVVTRTAYVTTTQALTPDAREALEAGHIGGVLVTSGSVARALQAQFSGELPPLISIGPQTTADLHRAGLTVAAEAEERTAASLVHTLEQVISYKSKG